MSADSSEDDLPVTPRNRTGIAEELSEDVKNLRDSPIRGKPTGSEIKKERANALEAMKKKRREKYRTSSIPPSSPGRPGQPINIDSDHNSDLEIIPEERDEKPSEDDEGVEFDKEEPGATAHDALYTDDEDNDFIDDADAPIGVPLEPMPIQFSMWATAKPHHHFRVAIGWMVRKKINPEIPLADPAYNIAFDKLSDKIAGLADSKFHSASWGPEFNRAIRARPEITINKIDRRAQATLEAHCEACNRRNHPAAFEVSFKGQPYKKATLEPLVANASNSDTDDSEESDISIAIIGSEEELNGEKPTYDENDVKIPPESRVFHLGRTCKRNAQVSHTLHHWRYHLNSWVVSYLERQGLFSAEQLEERDALSESEREELADDIIEEMESNGQIEDLLKLYKEQVNYSHNLDNDSRRGYGGRA